MVRVNILVMHDMYIGRWKGKGDRKRRAKKGNEKGHDSQRREGG